MDRILNGGGPLRGQFRAPGDKSISHRAAIFAALAEGTSTLRGFLTGRDCLATLDVLAALGVSLERSGEDLEIRGDGFDGLREPKGVLDCANSGTTLRLMVGLLVGRPFLSILSGSESLRSRPMARITGPLRALGAEVLGRDGGRLAPLVCRPARGLRAAPIRLEVASAQVKSAAILAALQADGRTEIIEPGPSRDHTERLLAAMGAPIQVDAERRAVLVEGSGAAGPALTPFNLVIPGDPSSAAFAAVAATIISGSEVTIEGLSANPTRLGLFRALGSMGADLTWRARNAVGGEPVADLIVRAGGLRAADFGGAEIVTMIDELPLLALAAATAEGRTTIRDAGELRVKESDRISSTVELLQAFGARVEEREDGFVIDGPCTLTGAAVEAYGDHRLAMLGCIAGLAAAGESRVAGASLAADSWPAFHDTIEALGGDSRAACYDTPNPNADSNPRASGRPP